MNAKRTLIDALLAGAADLKRNAALLDEINVFPVMDTGTGKNMSAAVNVLVETSADLARAPIERLPLVLETPLFAGAYGNSGIIQIACQQPHPANRLP